MVKGKNVESIKPKLESLRKKIHELSSKLKELGQRKEKLYAEKKEIDKELNACIKSAKELREKKKEIDEKIKKLKSDREKLNKEIKSMFLKFKEIKQKIGKKPRGRKKRLTSEDIIKQIESMEFAIQTEALNFDREKRYMERIKRLKAKLKEVKEEEARYKEFVSFKTQLKTKKLEADIAHARVQELANESSKLFKELTTYSEKIDKAKKQRASLQRKLKLLKTRIEKLNQELEGLLKNWSEITKKAFTISRERSLAHLQKKAKEVMDKFKKKKRLTTEDILLLQRQAIKE